MFRVLSHGVGVQTLTMIAMYARGDLSPLPDAAIFSNPQAETAEVLQWLEWSRQVAPFPVHEVSRGDLGRSATRVRRTRDGDRSYIQTAIPVYTKEGLRKGKGMRHCTRDFKIHPVRRKTRDLLGQHVVRSKVPVVEMLLGISTDEFDRAKQSEVPWIVNRYPLIEAGMSRWDCLKWMADHGYPEPPRSACIWCPFRGDKEWLALTPDEFARAVKFEKKLQAAYARTTELTSVPYLHSTRVPLDQVNLDPQFELDLNKFRNECEGMCGV
jgi:hypothetical protein